MVLRRLARTDLLIRPVHQYRSCLARRGLRATRSVRHEHRQRRIRKDVPRHASEDHLP
jgi:hypothetical protein